MGLLKDGRMENNHGLNLGELVIELAMLRYIVQQEVQDLIHHQMPLN